MFQVPVRGRLQQTSLTKCFRSPEVGSALWSWALLCTCTVPLPVWLGWELPSGLSSCFCVALSISLKLWWWCTAGVGEQPLEAAPFPVAVKV